MTRPVILALFPAPVALVTAARAAAVPAFGPTTCTVERVIDGDTFACGGGTHVRMLQINAPESDACGGAWAAAALANIFLRPGTQVRIDYDAVATDRYGKTLAAPILVARTALSTTSRSSWSTLGSRMPRRRGRKQHGGICGRQADRTTGR